MLPPTSDLTIPNPVPSFAAESGNVCWCICVVVVVRCTLDGRNEVEEEMVRDHSR